MIRASKNSHQAHRKRQKNNTTGSFNTANGSQALLNNTTASSNIALGFNAGGNLTTGNNNIALGSNAGSNLTTGSNNVDVVAFGQAGESGATRIGKPGLQTGTFIAGSSVLISCVIRLERTGQTWL
jgi:hypothetical protein